VTFVSILLPVYNGARYLDSAVRSLLGQTHTDFELLILDDGSSDGSAELAETFRDSRIRVLRSEGNMGLPATLNKGLRAARAELVARQDADDLSHPERLERQVRFLETHREVGLLGTRAWVVDENGLYRGSVLHALHHDALLFELLFDNAFVHSSVMLRRSLVLDQNGYDEKAGYNEDYDLWLRLARVTRLANLGERLVAWRVHPQSKTRRTNAAAEAANHALLSRFIPQIVGANEGERAIELTSRAQAGLTLEETREIVPIFNRWVDQHRHRVAGAHGKDFERTVARQALRFAFSRRHRSMARVAVALGGSRAHLPGMVRQVIAASLEKARMRTAFDPLRVF